MLKKIILIGSLLIAFVFEMLANLENISNRVEISTNVSHEENSSNIDFVDAADATRINRHNSNIMPEERIRTIVLSRVPGSRDVDIRHLKKEEDDGLTIFEGTLLYKELEYDFEIDAQTGDVRSWEIESIYD
ncbi:PepSY domain-containing protein [Enterococcus mundtii]|uniref:PepSY domain-containing protein n=1 Tax=Enterococcus mundtii TaxID=53346 RepID=A0A242KU93_ENTMU|nr:PepSY domain-containing protein [Enterococcus mundtii]OTP19985.1 hypothetical protein A5802_003213 [Enterococcus mundtii]OTP24816.1 hypothetical protein A5802_002971 [Enterococcus mundtii]